MEKQLKNIVTTVKTGVEDKNTFLHSVDRKLSPLGPSS